jgi:hypothetical protein
MPCVEQEMRRKIAAHEQTNLMSEGYEDQVRERGRLQDEGGEARLI